MAQLAAELQCKVIERIYIYIIVDSLFKCRATCSSASYILWCSGPFPCEVAHVCGPDLIGLVLSKQIETQVLEGAVIVYNSSGPWYP